MRRRVAQDLHALRILVGNDGERAVLLDAMTGVDQTAVHLASQRRLGQPGADRRRHVGNRQRLLEFPRRSIRQCNRQHPVTATNNKSQKTEAASAPVL